MHKAETRVAKNTLFLYVRMLLILLINLYTSRVILRTLGFEDYGIYNLVGGLVSLFAFMNSSLSGAASRFIAYSIGDGKGTTKNVFSTLLTIHCIVAAVLVLVCETFGMLFLDNLVIPEIRLYAAKITFHISVAATAISVLRIPYNASIIAHEDMKVFAYVSIVEVILKLAIVFLLNIIMYDKLITYSWLYLAIVILVSLIYAVYCIRSYADAMTFPGFAKDKFKKILSYFSWDLYGNLSVAANAQGTNIILNLFGGVVVNSACAIANQVRGAVYGFASNFMLAMNPQIIKNYAAGEIDDMINLMKRGGILSFMLLWLFALPLILDTEYVLTLWLGEYPNYAVQFTRLALVFSLIQSMYSSVNIGIHATGNIVKLSLISGSILLITVLASYIALKYGASLWIAFLFNIVAVFINAFVNISILHSLLREINPLKYSVEVYLKSVILAIVTAVIPVTIYLCMPSGIVRLFLIFTALAIVEVTYAFCFVLTVAERSNLIGKFIRRKDE